MHLHGLTALPRVEEGMTGDTPGGTEHGGVWEPPEPQALASNKHQHGEDGTKRLLSSSPCLAGFRVLDGRPFIQPCKSLWWGGSHQAILIILILQKG